jgi:hypothetical protein
MYRLFNKLNEATQGIIHPPYWPYVRDGLQRNLNTVIDYYRNNPTAVNSSHFIVKLLQSITIPQSQNIERYYDNVDSMSLNLSMALKMTSSIYHGRIFDGVFYGPGSIEILIANNEDFDAEEADINWEELRPIQVLRHPKTNLGLKLPDGTADNEETGIAVISINIPMLAVQYRAFRYREINRRSDDQVMVENEAYDTYSEKSAMEFVRMYVIPNMMNSHLDMVLFNRILNMQRGLPVNNIVRYHPFYLTDFSEKLNGIQEAILINIQTVKRSFADILKSVGLVTCENAFDFMKVPDTAPTRQITWALAISRLNALSFIFNVFSEGPGTRNQNEVDYIVRHMIAYKSNSIMKTMLPQKVYYEVEAEMEDVMKKAKSLLVK